MSITPHTAFDIFCNRCTSMVTELRALTPGGAANLARQDGWEITGRQFDAVCPVCLERQRLQERPQNYDEIEAFLDIFYETPPDTLVSSVRNAWDARREEMRKE